MKASNLDKLLPLVRKPSRYTGGEAGEVKKDLSKVKLTFGLAFPDAYEVGMSHLGMQILYQVLNDRSDVAAERVFAPWIDMEALMRERGLPLATLESGAALSELDVIGFSLQYELLASNVLNMLDLGGVPLRSAQRSGTDPIVIGGGPGTYNPEPIADFFDCFLLGDGEEAVGDICDVIIRAREEGADRAGVIKELSKIDGIYVPSFYDVTYNGDGTVGEIKAAPGAPEKVTRRVVADLNDVPLPTGPIIPYSAVHDRFSVEVTRGCTRGCRFCQAGMIYRPTRERTPDNVVKAAVEGLSRTGYDELGLLSLSTGDYTSIEPLLASLMPYLEDEHVAVSLPSLRVGTMDEKLASQIKRVRKTGFTMAPEAGSERLRRFINKGVEEEALLSNARDIFGLGWKAIKLYFMIGLPTETGEDVGHIMRLAAEVDECSGEKGGSGRGRSGRGGKKGRKPRVNVSVSTFVPKPHTPFQWAPQVSVEYTKLVQGGLRAEAAKKGLGFKWHEAGMSLIEGAISRGDRRLSAVIERAYRDGCRFCGWSEEFSIGKWQEAFDAEGLPIDFYTTRERDKEETLPWDHLDCGVTKEFLWDEFEAALAEAVTEDCARAECPDCGVCDHEVIKNRTYDEPVVSTPLKRRALPDSGGDPVRVRLGYTKTGRAAMLSHLELARVITRAIRAAGLPLRYSRGFHPHPKVAFGTPLPVGVESVDEYVDVELEWPSDEAEKLPELINAHLPGGVSVEKAEFISLQAPALSAIMTGQVFEISLKEVLPALAGRGGLEIDFKDFDKEDFDKEDINKEDINQIDGFLRDFMAMEEILVHLNRGAKSRELDIRPLITGLVRSGAALSIDIKSTSAGSVRPREVLMRLFGLPPERASLIPIQKTRTLF